MMTPWRNRSSGIRAMPSSMASLGELSVTGLPSTRTSPETTLSMPNSRRAMALRPLPSRPAMPSTSPACKLQRQLAGLCRARHILQLQQHLVLPGVGAGDAGEALRFAADDVLDDGGQRQFRQRRGDDMPAVAQDGRPVGDAHDLVHAVRDVDDGDAFRLQPPEEREQPVDIVGGKGRARLIEHQHAGVLRDRLDDLGELPLSRHRDRRPARADQRPRRGS